MKKNLSTSISIAFCLALFLGTGYFVSVSSMFHSNRLAELKQDYVFDGYEVVNDKTYGVWHNELEIETCFTNKFFKKIICYK